MIKLNEVHKVYVNGQTSFHALKNINLFFERGEVVTVFGPSGCGKTTLLNLLGGLDQPTSGDMVIRDQLTTNFQEQQWDYFRNYNIGFIFQSYNLIEHLPIVENVAMSVKLSGTPHQQAKEMAEKLLVQVGLEDHLQKLPGELSGGERQRVAIARALINDPDIILADEPTGALDKKTSREIMDLILSVSKDKLVIIVTHDKLIASEYSSRRIELKDGKIISDTKPDDGRVNVTNKKPKRDKKLSFKEAIRLAVYNLRGKLWRTLLVSFGLSVGIVGLILIDSFFHSVRNGLESQNAVLINNPDIYVLGTTDEHGTIMDMIDDIDGRGYFKEVLYSPQSYYTILRNVTEDTDLAEPIYGSGIQTPDAADISQTFTTLVGDSRFPVNNNEFMISVDMANDLVSSNINLTNGEIWDEIKGTQYLMYDEYEYGLDPAELYPDLLEGECIITEPWDGTEGVAPVGYDETVLGPFVDNLAELESYRPSRIIVSDTEELFCSDYDKYTWYIDYSAPIGSGYVMTLVGMYDNNLFWEMIVSDNVLFNNPNQQTLLSTEEQSEFQLTNLRVRAFVNEQSIDNKIEVITTIEGDNYFIQENVDLGINILAGITDFFMYIIQFIFSSITFIAVITGALMLLLILFISVMERKREIGLVRAMGGTRGDIRTIYTGETTIIGLIAGLMSIGLSAILVAILNIFIYNNYSETVIEYLPFVDPAKVLTIDYWTLLWAILGAIAVAIISGLAPAIKASRKQPIEALRNE